MSEFYHEFTPGFNWWYVVVPMAALLIYYIGWRIPRVRRDGNGKVRLDMRANMRLGYLLSGLFRLGCSVLVFVESQRGIVQFFDNSLTRQDSPVWSLIFAGGAIAAIWGVIYALCVFSYAKGRERKKRRLIYKYRLRKRDADAVHSERSCDASPTNVVRFPHDAAR